MTTLEKIEKLRDIAKTKPEGWAFAKIDHRFKDECYQLYALRMPKQMIRNLKIRSKMEGSTVSELIRQSITAKLA